jgi:Cu-processing system permease protein
VALGDGAANVGQLPVLTRLLVVTFNTYREAVRARILHGLFAMALFTAGYCVVVGQYTSGSAARVLGDLGAASVSLYGVLVTIVLCAAALHREIEQRTLFPILARPIARAEYLTGKFFGTLLTLVAFVLANTAVFLAALAATSQRPVWQPALALGAGVAVAAAGARLKRGGDSWGPLLGSALSALCCWYLADAEPENRRLLGLGAVLTLNEVSIIAAVATLFSAFSSPFLSAILTLGIFLMGRSADTLAHLPARLFGQAIHDAAEVLSRFVPNLMLYVPSRALLEGTEGWARSVRYVGLAALQSAGWCCLFLTLACLIFRRRDLT